jgi:xanthine/uracil permease
MPREAQTRFREEHFEHHDNGRSLTDLLKELRDETVRLFRQEVALAKTEVSDKAAKTGRNVGCLAVGGLIAYAGVLVLLMAGVVGLYVALEAAGLSNATAGWLAPLIVGGVVLAIGYGLVQKALSTLKHESLTPERTVETMQDNTNWIKEKVS